MKILRCLTIVAFVVQFALPSIGASAPAKREIKARELRGRDIALLLASTCSAKNWARFQKFAKRTHYLTWENQKPIALVTTKDSLSNSASGFEFRYRPENPAQPMELAMELAMEPARHGLNLRGEDSCDLISKLDEQMNAPVTKSAWNLFVTTAYAQLDDAPHVTEDEKSDRMAFYASLIGLGAGAVLCSPTIAVAGGGILAYVTIAGLAYELYSEGRDAVHAYQGLKLKGAFEALLNKPLSLECSSGLVVIHSGDQKVVVRKGWTYSVDIFGNDSGAPLYTDHDLAQVPQSREFITNLARNCETSDQAKVLTERLGGEVKDQEAKVQALAAGTSTPATLQPQVTR